MLTRGDFLQARKGRYAGRSVVPASAPGERSSEPADFRQMAGGPAVADNCALSGESPLAVIFRHRHREQLRESGHAG